MKVNIGVFAHNSQDWDRVMAEDFSQPAATPDWKYVQAAFELGDLAEPLGFDGIWAPEHFGTPYGMTPNPVQTLTYFAARTECVQFGTMVIVAPSMTTDVLGANCCVSWSERASTAPAFTEPSAPLILAMRASACSAMNLGSAIAARIARMVITTISSISVKPAALIFIPDSSSNRPRPMPARWVTPLGVRSPSHSDG